MKFRLKTNLWFKGKGYKAGTIIDLNDDEIKDYRIERILEKDLLVPVDGKGEIDDEREIQDDEEDEKVETSIESLIKIKGIGRAYARQIKDDFPYVSDIKDASAEEIAFNIPGVGMHKAEKIKEEFR